LEGEHLVGYSLAQRIPLREKEGEN
jgi:hypothetical protein